MKTAFFSVAIAATIFSTAAAAQDSGRQGWGQREQTRQEAQQRADTMFQMLDANKDGTVTKAEAQQALAQFEAARGGDSGRGGGRMQRMIDNAFSTAPAMTLGQFEAQALARFDAQDTNRDGTVSAAERQQQRAQRPQ